MADKDQESTIAECLGLVKRSHLNRITYDFLATLPPNKLHFVRVLLTAHRAVELELLQQIVGIGDLDSDSEEEYPLEALGTGSGD